MVLLSAAKTSLRPRTPSPPTSSRPKAMRSRFSGLAVTFEQLKATQNDAKTS